MPTVILVSGVSNSGKTKSIRKFLENRGIFHLRRIGDITAIFPIQRSGKARVLAVASGGDDPYVVNRNLAFFAQHKWDVVVCASRSRGRTVQLVANFAQRYKARLITIPTVRVKKPAIASAIARIAAQVERNLP
jgi:hypothetical protein